MLRPGRSTAALFTPAQRRAGAWRPMFSILSRWEGHRLVNPGRDSPPCAAVPGGSLERCMGGWKRHAPAELPLATARSDGDRHIEGRVSATWASWHTSPAIWRPPAHSTSRALPSSAIGNRSGGTASLSNLGNVTHHCGDLEAARTLSKSRHHRAIGNRLGEASSLGNWKFSWTRIGRRRSRRSG